MILNVIPCFDMYAVWNEDQDKIDKWNLELMSSYLGLNRLINNRI